MTKDNVINEDALEIIGNCIISSPKLFSCTEYRFVSQEHDEFAFQYFDQYETPNLFFDHEVVFVRIKLGDVNQAIWP